MMTRNAWFLGLSAALLLATAGCSGAPESTGNADQEEMVGEADGALFGQTGSYWSIDSMGITSIPVCWLTPGFASEKAWVKDSVDAQWAAPSSVAFVGWGACDANTPAFAVRIAIADTVSAPASFVGMTAMNPSMTLNFTFHNWMGRGSPFLKWGWLVSNCEDLDTEYCIRSIAIHEFGHALGFQHEQDRVENGGQCDKGVVPSTGDALTPYDQESIMNYCYEWGRQTITDMDMVGVQEVYGLAHAGAAAALDQNNQLEVFIHGTDDHVWRAIRTTPGGAWSGWTSLGGTVIGAPAVGKSLNGRLEVVARGADSKLWHNFEVAAGVWSGWASFGGPAVKDDPVIGVNADGRLEVFARGKDDNAAWHIWQGAQGVGWSSWASFGGWVTSALAVGRNQNGELQLFGRGTDGGIYFVRQVVHDGGWGNWASLGGVATSAPTVALDGFNRLQVFARNKDRGVSTIRQSAANSTNWDGWSSIGATVTSVPQVGRNQDGRLEVFGRGLDNALWHTAQSSVGGAWYSWTSLGGGIVSGTAVANGSDGRLETFVTGAGRGLWNVGQNGANGTTGWGGWLSLGNTVALSVRH